MAEHPQINGFVFQNLISLDEVISLRDEVVKVEYNGMSDKEVVASLSDRPQVANPDPPPQVIDPAKFNVDHILTQLAPVLNNAEFSMEAILRILDSIEDGTPAKVIVIGKLLREKGVLTAGQYTSFVAEVEAQIDDPNHPATVAGTNKLSTLLGRTIGGLTVQELIKAREA